jgi:hypothetical protein
LASHGAREQKINSDFATSINSFVMSRHFGSQCDIEPGFAASPTD